MPATQLKFEKPLADLENRAAALKDYVICADSDIGSLVDALQKRTQELHEYFWRNLSPWEKVLTARNPMRPQPLDLCRRLFTDFIELHGDRRFGDDAAICGGFAYFDGHPIMLIVSRKGRDFNEYVSTHFGCAQPEGYRKALRLMQLAEKADCPILVFVDTPGAYPGIESEERHIGEAIACNLREMFRLKVPIVTIVTGEGGSGGALGLAVGNRVLMLSNAYYSVITPEGCAAILWRSPDKAEEAAGALRLTAADLLKLGIIDGIIQEPLDGAQSDYNATADAIRDVLRELLPKLRRKNARKLRDERYERFRKMGQYIEQ